MFPTCKAQITIGKDFEEDTILLNIKFEKFEDEFTFKISEGIGNHIAWHIKNEMEALK